MAIMRKLFRGLLAAVVLTGCAADMPTTRIVFSKAEVNGNKVCLVMDTGSDFMWLSKARARRLGLKHGAFEQATGLKFALSSVLEQVTVGRQTFAAPLPIVPFSLEVDGLVGWPEIRDNILVFDASTRTIRRAERLPPETAGWLKLKIVPDRIFLLETPLAGGKTGTILVDTGAPFAVQLRSADFDQWKAAHPHALLMTHRENVASFGSSRFQVAWADQIKIGELTLTDLAVEDMPAKEAKFLENEVPGTSDVWVMGAYALLRMDMVVDWKGGFAYLHPLPPPGPFYPGVKRPPTPNVPVGGNWTVADDVHLSSENLFLISGSDKWDKKDTVGALADFDRAIEQNPNDPDAYNARGDIQEWKDDTKDAIADYSRAIALNPKDPEGYRRRGVARDVQGDFSGALSDYQKVIEQQPANSEYERLYRQVLLHRLGRPTEDFSKSLAAWKTGWTRTVALFLAGALDEKALLDAAKTSDVEPVAGQKCEALYYIGEMRFFNGDKAGAREAFQKCRASRLKDYDEYHFAGAELARLDAVPPS